MPISGFSSFELDINSLSRGLCFAAAFGCTELRTMPSIEAPLEYGLSFVVLSIVCGVWLATLLVDATSAPGSTASSSAPGSSVAGPNQSPALNLSRDGKDSGEDSADTAADRMRLRVHVHGGNNGGALSQGSGAGRSKSTAAADGQLTARLLYYTDLTRRQRLLRLSFTVMLGLMLFAYSGWPCLPPQFEFARDDAYHHLDVIYDYFDSKDIPLYLVESAALFSARHGELEMRDYHDIDLGIKQADVPRVMHYQDELHSMGYHLKEHRPGASFSVTPLLYWWECCELSPIRFFWSNIFFVGRKVSCTLSASVASAFILIDVIRAMASLYTSTYTNWMASIIPLCSLMTSSIPPPRLCTWALLRRFSVLPDLFRLRLDSACLCRCNF